MFSIGFWDDHHYASSAKIRYKTLDEKLLPRSIRFVFLCTFGAQSGNHEKRRSDLKIQQMFVQIESMRFIDLLRYKENRKTFAFFVAIHADTWLLLDHQEKVGLKREIRRRRQKNAAG